MFGWFKKEDKHLGTLVNHANGIRNQDYKILGLEKQMASLNQEIFFLNKVALFRDYKIVDLNVYWASDKKPVEEQREELRKTGYSFWCKKGEDKEVWVKYPPETKN
jgi:hypothetical protein